MSLNENICRFDGKNIFLSILRTDDEAMQLYAQWLSDETTSVFIERQHEVLDISSMPGWVTCHDVLRMGIVDKETDQLIGYCHIDHRAKDQAAWLSINIGDKDFKGHGYGTEVMQLLLKVCFQTLGVYSVHLDVLEANKAGVKCYEKCGFRVSGRYRGHCYINRQHNDWLHMDILYDEWEVRQKAKELLNDG